MRAKKKGQKVVKAADSGGKLNINNAGPADEKRGEEKGGGEKPGKFGRETNDPA